MSTATSSRAKSLLVLLAGTLLPAHSARAFFTADTANIGLKSNYPSNSTFWKTGVDYSLRTDGTDSFVNAPGTAGTLHFRRANLGPLNFSTAPDLMEIDSLGQIDARSSGSYGITGITSANVANSQGVQYTASWVGVWGLATGANLNGTAKAVGVVGTAGPNGAATTAGIGVLGETNASWPGAGVKGTNSASGGTALVGIGTNATSSTGVYGQGASIGTQGNATAASGVGVSGVAGGVNAHAIEGNCNGSCATSGGYAGYFFGNVYLSGTLTPGSSDVRLKKNVQPLKGSLDRLLQLRGVTFEWKEPKENGEQTGTQRGFIAQEVEKVMPEWIGTDAKGFKTIGVPGRAFEAMLVESLRTLKTQNDELRERVTRLEKGRGPTMSSLSPGDLGAGVALGLVPLGLVAAYRGRRKRENP